MDNAQKQKYYNMAYELQKFCIDTDNCEDCIFDDDGGCSFDQYPMYWNIPKLKQYKIVIFDHVDPIYTYEPSFKNAYKTAENIANDFADIISIELVQEAENVG